MNKKMFAFGGLIIAFIIGLYCMVSSFSAFTRVALDNAIDAKVGSDVAYGIGFLLTGLLLLAMAIAGIALLIIFSIKKKEFKFPLIPIIVFACAAVMLLSYDIMIMVSDGTTISNAADGLKSNVQEIKSYYSMAILTALLDIFINLIITFIVAALGVLSLINFKKNKAQEQPQELE